MNPKAVVILVVFLLLAVLALWLSRDGGPVYPSGAPEEDSIGQPLLTEQELGQTLTRIVLHQGEASLPQLELVREGGRWRVEQPHRFAADLRAVDQLLTLLAELRGRPTDEPGGMVLDGPSVTLDGVDHQVVLMFSSRVGAGRAVYTVRRDGKDEDLIAQDTLVDLFESLDPTAFYARQITPPLLPELGRIEIDNNGERSVLVQQDGRWQIGEQETSERALEQRLETYPGVADYVKLIGAVEVNRHIPYEPGGDLKPFGLERPLITTRFIPIDAGPTDRSQARVLAVGVPADPGDQTRFVSYGKANDPDPAVFTIATPIALAFGQSATAFRDPRIIAVPPTLIESIGLKYPDGATQRIALTSEGPTLTHNSSDPVAVAPQALADMLKSLADARAVDYVHPKTDQWAVTVSVQITPKLGGEPEALTLYADPDSDRDEPTVLIQRGKEPIALRVPRAAVAGLLNPISLVVDHPE